MAQIDIDKFVISLRRYFGENKGIATTLDRCLFSLGLKYVDTPTGGRLERVDQPTMLEKIMWKSGEQKAIKHNNNATIDSNLNDYCCKVYSALHKENDGNLSFERLQHLAMDIYKWCKEQHILAEWSEEDNKIIEEIINDIECARAINYHAPKEGYEFRKNWLKSLRFQNHWKPSDEMLEALYRVIPENTMVISEDEMLLDKLYQGLKYGRVLSEK